MGRGGLAIHANGIGEKTMSWNDPSNKTDLETREMKSCHEWVQGFNAIPGGLIEKAYKDNPEELELLAGGTLVCGYCGNHAEDDKNPEPCECGRTDVDEYHNEAIYAWPAGWGTLWSISNGLDEEWIENNLKTVAACGFLVYTSDETGVILGIDGGGYNFYDAHWIKLYKARGLVWHMNDEEKNVYYKNLNAA